MAHEQRKWTRHEIVKLVLDMERELNTDSWKTDGIYCWPWFRMQLFFFLIRHLELIDVESVKTRTPNSLTQRFTNSLRQLVKFIQIGRADILFVGAQVHRGDWNGKSYNKFFDPIRLSGEFINRSVLVEYSSVTSGSMGESRIFSFTDLFLLIRFFVAKKKLTLEFETDSKLVTEYLHKSVPELNTKMLAKSFYTQWPILLRTISVWKIVLRRLQPKKIATLCYYSKQVFALNVAAAEMGIPVFEMQHGPINPLHLAYGNYESLPQSSNSTLLPTSFLVWEKATQKTLKASFPLKASVIVGHPWTSFLEGQVPLMARKKKIITYAIQPFSIGEVFPPYLVKWIQESVEEYVWWFRLHPRQAHEYDLIVAQAQKNFDAGSWEIDQATQLPLPVVLKNTDLVFTFTSGVAIEAAMMGIPAFACHVIAPEYFKEENKEKLVYICSRADEALTWNELKNRIDTFVKVNRTVGLNSNEKIKSVLL